MTPDRPNIQPLDPKAVGDAFLEFCGRKPKSIFRPNDQVVELITGDNVLFTAIDGGVGESMRYSRTYWIPKVEYKKPNEEGVSEPEVKGFAPSARLYVVGSDFARLHIYHEKIGIQKNNDEPHDKLVWSYRGDYKHFSGSVSNEYGRVELRYPGERVAEDVSLHSFPLGDRDDEEFGSVNLDRREVGGSVKYVETSRSTTNQGYSYSWKVENGRLKVEVRYGGEVQIDADLRTELDFEELKENLIPVGLARDPLTEDLRPDSMWRNADIATALDAKIVFTDNWGQRALDKTIRELGLEDRGNDLDI
jgi:hypothetical protein